MTAAEIRRKLNDLRAHWRSLSPGAERAAFLKAIEVTAASFAKKSGEPFDVEAFLSEDGRESADDERAFYEIVVLDSARWAESLFDLLVVQFGDAVDVFDRMRTRSRKGPGTAIQFRGEGAEELFDMWEFYVAELAPHRKELGDEGLATAFDVIELLKSEIVP